VCVVLRGVCKSHDKPKVRAITTQESRQGKLNIPSKVMCHFFLIPCLKHMFRAHVTSNLVVWHNENKSTNGLVQPATNSKV